MLVAELGPMALDVTTLWEHGCCARVMLQCQPCSVFRTASIDLIQFWARIGIPCNAQFHITAYGFAPCVQSARGVPFCNLVWALSLWQAAPPPTWLSSLCDAATPHLPRMSPRSLAVLLLGLADLGAQPSQVHYIMYIISCISCILYHALTGTL